MPQRILWVFGLAVSFLLIGGVLFLYLRPLSKSPPSPAGEEALPKREPQKPLVTPPSAEEMPYETFTTAEGKLSFEYPAAWIRTEIQNLETVLPKEFIDKYGLKMPLILSDPRGAQISLSVYQFEKGTSLDAAMDAFKADLVEMGQPYNEVSRQTVGDALVVDSTVDAGQGGIVKVRDLLFLVPGDDKDTVYNISFSARLPAGEAGEPNWSDYETIFNHVQNSAKLSL